MLILNLNMPKANNNFEYALKNCGSTEANRSISYQSNYTEMLIGDKCPWGLIWCTSRDTFGRLVLIYVFHLACVFSGGPYESPRTLVTKEYICLLRLI